MNRERSREREREENKVITMRSPSPKNANNNHQPSIMSQESLPQLKKSIYIQNLPKKPSRLSKAYNQEVRPIQLCTNNYQICFQKLQIVYIYSIKFTPDIQRDNKQMLRSLINSIADEIHKEIGLFVLSGFVLFSLTPPKEFSLGFSKSVTYNHQSYTIEIKKVKQVDMQQLKNPDPKVAFLPLNWFNILIRSFLRNLKFFEHGRTRKFYDPTDRSYISETKLEVLKGYSTSFNVTEGGLNLRIDVCHKLIRQDNMLQVLKQIYHDYADKDKDEKRDLVKNELIGTQILANYGNYRIYVVDDVVFDIDTSKFEVEITDQKGESTFITINSYFKTRYNIHIQDSKAPLLVNNTNNQKKTLYFVPELCIQAGVPKNYNEFMRKQVSKHCSGDPDKRYREIQAVTNRLFKEANEINQQMKDSIGIQINDKPKIITAKNLKPPTILFGKDTSTNNIHNGNFVTGKNPAFKLTGQVSYAVIHTMEFRYREFERAFQEFTSSFGLTFEKEMKNYKLGEQRFKHLQEIEDIILNKIAGRYQIVIIIVDQALKKQYKQIKQLTLLQAGILSQVICQDTLYKRGMKVICSKVIQQILSKIGKTVWAVQKPIGIPDNMICMGAVVNAGIAGICSSMDSNFSEFYNQAFPQTNGNRQILEQLDQYLEQVFTNYHKEHKVYPESMIYYREGLDDERSATYRQSISAVQLDAKQNTVNHISSLKELINETILSKQWLSFPHYYIITLGRICNPPFGTVIDNDIVSMNYEFLMVAQHANRGSVVPTLYRVIYDNLNLPMEMIEDFTYQQCYNYQNWTGAIKMPAILQNAQRLSKFVGECLGKDAQKELKSKLFYL